MLLAWSVVGEPLLHAAEPAPAEARPSQVLAVRLIDGEGKPVAGAHVASFSKFSRHAMPTYDEAGWGYGGLHAVSDEDGVARLTGELELLGCLIARQVSRKLVALEPLDSQHLPSEITLTLQPECRISGRVVCRELEALGRKVTGSVTYLYLGKKRPFCCISEQAEFHFFVPPGTYELDIDGDEVLPGQKTVTVAPGLAELKLEPVNLLPKRLTLLEGQPAPELQEIVAWKNGPLRLADLRGKVVLLYFWGHGCVPCVKEMPKFFAFHDQYRERGLVVIGIHVEYGEEQVDTVAKFDAKLAAVKHELWADRDFPFPVALILYQPTPHRPDAKQTARCRVEADYGITTHPTAVLIDRQGRVVKAISTTDPESEALLVKTLEAPE